MLTFQERSIEFQKELEPLQKKHGLQLYAAIVLAQNGEIGPTLKLANILPETEVVGTKKESSGGIVKK